MTEVQHETTADRVQQYLKQVAEANGITDLSSSELAECLTQNDPLKHVREQFHYPKCGTLPGVDKTLCDPESDSIYMCGNSLGLMPKVTEKFMMEQLDKWAKMGVFGHLNGDLPWASCDLCATEGVSRLVGAKPVEVALCNGLTVNIHVLLTAFYKPTETRHKILLESKAFPSDHYAIESQIRLHGRTVEDSMVCLTPREGEEILRTEDILSYIEEHGEEIAIIFLPGVQYYTGQLLDIPTITTAGKKKSCYVGWDLAHAFANVPLQLHYWDVDFACWCSYKYGCTGAGGLAGLFIHERFKTDKRERMLGWWSHREETRFNMDNVLDLDEGAAGYRISNPPISLVVPVMGILEVFKTVSLEDLRSKSLYLTGYLEFLIKKFFAESAEDKPTKISCSIITPQEFHERGCQLSLCFSAPIDIIYSELVKRGVAVDKRYPNVIRVTPVHLYNNYVDCHRFINALIDSCKVAENSV
ncbi:Kynureninase [Parelaphostrongylus tenuis]|uniref:Kynureninase n=1 Tax=Parelaphostrongylus tenuis TaxID=148309 RepID=A0AAD5N5S4_PARTN|nr:Kynureninase [Parelaphostrongylus tenuis]